MIRVLLVGPHWSAGWTESTRDALKLLGCEVKVLYYNRTPNQQAASHFNVRLSRLLQVPRLAAPNLLRQLFWVSNGWQLDYLILEAASESPPDIVLVLKGEIILPFTLHKLKHLASSPIIATWWVDNPLLYDERYKWWMFPLDVPLYDHLFIFDKAYFEPLQQKGAKLVTFLPCACDPSIYHPEQIDVIRQSDSRSSVCFIGAYYPNRGLLLEAMSDVADVGIWGPGWVPFLEKMGDKIEKNIFRGENLPVEKVNLAYQSATIVLNSHHPQTKRAGLNTRAFEALASGAFQLMDYVPEMERLLVPGEELAVYHSPTEAAFFVRKFLENPSERQRIAKNGFQRVLAEHTYYHRMRTLLSTLGFL